MPAEHGAHTFEGMQPTLRQVPPSRPPAFYACDLEAQLASLDGGHVATRSPTKDNDVLQGVGQAGKALAGSVCRVLFGRLRGIGQEDREAAEKLCHTRRLCTA